MLMESITRGWRLMETAKEVLAEHRRLVIFPILCALCLALESAVASLAFAYLHGQPGQTLWAVVGDGVDLLEQKLDTRNLWLVLPWYFVEYLTVLFFNTALAGATLAAFRGQDIGIAGGLRLAGRRLPALLAWTLLASTVDLGLRFLEERASTVARFFTGVFGLLWSLAVVLVVPVLAAEGLGPLAALRRSAALFKKTWGEKVGSWLGMFPLALVVFLVVLAAAIGCYFLLRGHPAFMLLGFAGCAFVFLVVCAALTACGQIFNTILYAYATEGPLPNDLDAEALKDAFPMREPAETSR